jgi:hypothetical protein
MNRFTALLLLAPALTSACQTPDRIISQGPDASQNWTLSGTLWAAPDPFRMDACESFGAPDEIFVDSLEPLAYTPGGWDISYEVMSPEPSRGFINNMDCGLWQPDAHTLVFDCPAGAP